jgi:hypothetical protein
MKAILAWVHYFLVYLALVPALIVGAVLLFVPDDRPALPALVVAVALQGWAIWHVLVYRRGRSRYRQALNLATESYQANQFDQAEKRIIAGLRRLDGAHRPYLRSLLPWTQFRRGRLDAAIVELGDQVHSPDDRTGELRENAGQSLALMLALAGRPDDAEKMLDWSTRFAEQLRTRESHEPRRARVAALIHLRRGQHLEALAVLERHAGAMGHALSVEEMRITWLWRAFAENALSSPRSTGESERWLSLIRQSGSSPLAPVAVKWPQLSAFLETHGLK